MELKNKIEEILNKPLNDNLNKDFYKKYHESFKESGEHKAKSVINQVKSLGNADLAKMVYVSIGGSYGFEVLWVLKNTDIKQAVLLEIDSNACKVASEMSKDIPKGKKLEIICGDVVEKISKLQTFLSQEISKDESLGVIISANAVFHELPYRANNYNQSSFLKELFWNYKKCIFICREPCYPTNWQGYVSITIPEIDSDTLYKFASHINYKLSFSSKITRSGPKYVNMSAGLATEVLHKIFYIDDFEYEIQEKLTGIVADDFVSIIEDCFDYKGVMQTRLNSMSFSKKYNEMKIDCVNGSGQKLSAPLSFINILASKGILD